MDLLPVPIFAAGNSHAAAVAHCQKVYDGKATGFCSDHLCESSEGRIDPGNLTYGEVTYAGMEAVYDALNLKQGDVFFDLGSGVGKLVLYVALRAQVARSVGLEVGEKRHALAVGACERLKALKEEPDAKLSSLTQPCSEFQVLQADICKYAYQDASVVVITNVCMDMQVQSRAVEQLLRCSAIRRLVTTCALPPNNRLKLARAVCVACTWCKQSSWQVYDVMPAAPPRFNLLRSGINFKPPALLSRANRAKVLASTAEVVLRSSSTPALAQTQGEATADPQAPTGLPALRGSRSPSQATAPPVVSTRRRVVPKRWGKPVQQSTGQVKSFLPDSDGEIFSKE